MTIHQSITELQWRLDAASSEQKKIWWEKYLRGAAAFRGVGIPHIRDILAVWRHDTGVADLPVDEQLDIAMALFEIPITEDKLAGILLLQEYLRMCFDWKDLLPKYESLFERNLIYDWNTCDWFCVRVLGPTLAEHGMPFVRALSKWQNATHLWQARSAAVPFIKVAEDSTYYPAMLSVCTTLIARPERFAKTAVGWLLREISRYDPSLVLSFLKSHVGNFSLESSRNAMKYIDRKTRMPLLEKIKRTEQGGGAVRLVLP